MDDSFVQQSTKMKLVAALLTKLKDGNSRVVIFSQYEQMLQLIARYLDHENMEYFMLTGFTPREQREKEIKLFNETSTQFIYLITTKAGGCGISLTSADTVILYDQCYNPESDLQAIDRVHRFGQKNPVKVYRLLTQDTIEESILLRSVTKGKLNASVMGNIPIQYDINNEANKSTIAFIATKIAKDKIDTCDGAIDIDELIRNSENSVKNRSQHINNQYEKKTRDFAKQLTFHDRTARTNVAKVRYSTLEGVDYGKAPKKQPDLILDGKRVRKKPDWFRIALPANEPEAQPIRKRRKTVSY